MCVHVHVHTQPIAISSIQSLTVESAGTLALQTHQWLVPILSAQLTIIANVYCVLARCQTPLKQHFTCIFSFNLLNHFLKQIYYLYFPDEKTKAWKGYQFYLSWHGQLADIRVDTIFLTFYALPLPLDDREPRPQHLTRGEGNCCH